MAGLEYEIWQGLWQKLFEKLDAEGYESLSPDEAAAKHAPQLYRSR